MIKFPRVHIAESVVNRILDTAEALERRRPELEPPPPPAPPPPVPEPPAAAGAELDAALSTPLAGDVPPLDVGEPPADELALAVARGDDIIGA